MKYDIFISHATEDKDEFVRDLVQLLNKADLKVWYDEEILRIGDSVSEKIDLGLKESRHGVVVLSKAFFKKNWTRRELRGLEPKQMNGTPTILPIWHGVTKDDVAEFSPSLADLLAADSSNGIDAVARMIVNVVHSRTDEGSDKAEESSGLPIGNLNERIIYAEKALKFLQGWSGFLALIQIAVLTVLMVARNNSAVHSTNTALMISVICFLLSVFLSANVIGAIPPIMQRLPEHVVKYSDIYQIRNYFMIPLWMLAFLEHIFFEAGFSALVVSIYFPNGG